MPILSLTWERYRRHWVRLVAATLLSILMIAGAWILPILFGLIALDRLGFVLLAIPFLLLVIPFTSGITNGALGAAAQDQEPTELLDYGQRFFGRMLGLVLFFALLGVVVGLIGWFLEEQGYLGRLLSTFLSLALSATQVVAMAAVVIEDMSVSESLTRAFELWRHFREMFLLGLVTALVSSLVALVPALFIIGLVSLGVPWLAVLLAIPLLLLIQPFTALYPFVRYVERLRPLN